MNEIISLFVTAPFAHWEILLASTVLFFMLGMVWYSPSFPTGKVWMRYQKMDKNYKPNMTGIMLGQLLMTLLFIQTILALWLALGPLGLADWVLASFILKIYGGFVVTKEVSSWLFERKPLPFIVVGVGYYLVGILIVVSMCSYFL